MSSFSGIQRALTGLQSQRQAMDVAGQNIANANTPGYTRQRVELQALAATGQTSVHGAARPVGDGVGVVTTARLNESFLDAKVHRQTAVNAETGKRAETLTSVERLLSEPGETGLSSKLDAMWSSWSTAALSPTNSGARGVVLARSQDVVDAISSGSAQVATLWSQQDVQVDTMLSEINTTAKSVAELNDKIGQSVAGGGTPNDLLDTRDQLVTRLVELTGATAEAGRNGTMNVYVGGTPIVSGQDSYRLQVAAGGPTTIEDTKTTPPKKAGIEWVSGGGVPSGISVRSGELGASLEALNTTLPDASRQFDAVAASLASSVNTQHAAGTTAGGVTGSPFFATTDGSTTVTATNLKVAVTDGSALALASTGSGSVDGSNAAAIARIATQRATPPGTTPAVADGPNAVWTAATVLIGTRSLAATTSATTAVSSLRSAVADQQSSAGVSLDEETANLLVLQRAYEGAARVLTAVDQALDTLINRTGLVGR